VGERTRTTAGVVEEARGEEFGWLPVAGDPVTGAYQGDVACWVSSRLIVASVAT